MELIIFILILWKIIDFIEKRKRDKKNKEEINQKAKQDEEISTSIQLSQYDTYFQKLQEIIDDLNGNRYILHSEKEEINNKFDETYHSIKKISEKKTIDPSEQKLLDAYSEFDKLVEKNNQTYLEQKIKENSELFSNVAGNSLDEKQRFAVVQEERNHLVIAGAGTGKTLTILGKIKYLMEVRGISPEEILPISYSKKSADELQKKITEKLRVDVKAMTFHKLGKGIIEEERKKKIDVAEDDFAKDIINNFFRKIIVEKPSVINDFIQFYSLYINSTKDENLYSNLAEFYDNTRNYDFETLKSKLKLVNVNKITDSQIETLKRNKITINEEFLRSIEEVSIANFLFLNGIEYQYETLYPYDEKGNQRKQYRPDFYLPKYEIWLEHFGINKDGSTPPGFDNKEYTDGIEWKRTLHKKNKTTLLETYSWQNREGILLDELENMLLEKNVKFEPVDSLELYQKLFFNTSRKKDRHLGELQGLFKTFLHLYKSSNKDLLDIDTLETTTTREKLFVNVFKEIFKYYQSELEKDKRIDFDDMINEASRVVKTTEVTFPYKYILIDEYQDISFSRYNFVKAIRDKTNSNIMCVGDDWQSIYRFSGSDLSLFNKFEDYFGFTVITDIVNTHRNSKELIDVAGNFIQKNPEQIKKQLKSEKHTSYPIQILMYKDSYDNNDKYSPEDYRGQAVLFAIEHIFEQEDKYSSEILLLGRTYHDLEDILGNFKTPEGRVSFNKSSNSEKEIQIKCSKYPNTKIKFLSVHKAKGLEAENVIILNMRNNLLGFPNQIADDPILSLVLANKDSYDFAEERRLFYVAITRTKNRTYLITPEGNRSIFIKDILEEENVDIKRIGIDEHEDYGKCTICGGNLVVRLGRHGPFLSCENYFRHRDQKCIVKLEEIPEKYICPICGKFLVKKEGKNGSFAGCSGYSSHPDGCPYTRDLNKNRRKYYI